MPTKRSRRLAALGLQIVTTADAAYPRRLAAIEMPPHVLYVLGDIGALEARGPPWPSWGRDARRMPAGRRPPGWRRRSSPSATTVVSGLATGIDGAAHAATRARRGIHGGGHRIGSCRPLPDGSTNAWPRSIVDSGGAIVSELAPGHPPDARHVPAAEPGHQRTGRCDGRGRGARPQRRPDHRVVGPRAGPRVFPRARHDRRTRVGRLPRVPSRVRGDGPDRGGYPAADRGSRSRRTDSPNQGVPEDAAATLVEVGEAAGRIGREVLTGRATVDELVAVTGWPVASVLTALTVLERQGLVVGIHGRFRAAGQLAAADPNATRRRSSARI